MTLRGLVLQSSFLGTVRKQDRGTALEEDETCTRTSRGKHKSFSCKWEAGTGLLSLLKVLKTESRGQECPVG